MVFAHSEDIQAQLATKKRANPPPELLKGDIDTKSVSQEQMHNPRIRQLIN